MTEPDCEIYLNRKASKYSLGELVIRILWGGITPLFRFSPRVLFSWRTFLLRVFGARVGKEVHVYNTATIYMPWNLEIGDWSCIGEHAYIYNLGKIVIGSKTTISQRAHLCAGTHDYTNPLLPLLKPPIHVGDQVWICADAFVGPGVTIGKGAIVAARAVVVKDVEPWDIVAGNPARMIKKRVLLAGSA
ncbi:MAG: putative colanic acid biosynthesis acetyltransferase [Chlorobium sp.]|nr:putative colanic acid biosynthesis acetyltransferase [Chlorobium sp.]